MSGECCDFRESAPEEGDGGGVENYGRVVMRGGTAQGRR